MPFPSIVEVLDSALTASVFKYDFVLLNMDCFNFIAHGFLSLTITVIAVTVVVITC